MSLLFLRMLFRLRYLYKVRSLVKLLYANTEVREDTQQRTRPH